MLSLFRLSEAGENLFDGLLSLWHPHGVLDNGLLLYSITISPLSAVSDRQAAGAIQSLYATYGGNGCHPVGVK
ncbi:MAG: hypothetical protein RBR30_00155 [Tenuifilaceae bacterium]|nr:hypothetical protein [Tenuifilaceae bacterium]